MVFREARPKKGCWKFSVALFFSIVIGIGSVYYMDYISDENKVPKSCIEEDKDDGEEAKVSCKECEDYFYLDSDDTKLCQKEDKYNCDFSSLGRG